MANEDKRIIELPASTSILNDDWIAKDSASQDTTRLQLSFLKQLCGGNNFAGEWHSGITYTKEAYVTHEGKLYHNIKGTSVVADSWTSSQWTQVSISNELRKIVESLAPTFDTSTNYKVDDLVIYDNTLYRCIVAHTAGTWVGSHFGTVKVSSLLLYSIMDNFTDLYWENYSGSPVNYTKGTVIHKGLNLYRCKANTTNQSWESSKWELVDVTDLLATEHGYIQSLFSIIAPTFSTSTSYNVDDFVIYNNQLYMCIYPHNGAWNSGHFLLCTVSNTLQALYRNLADTYSFSGTYVKDDVVNYAGVLLRCIVDTATSPIVFSEWEQVTVEQLINEKVADVQIAGQTTTDENHISDLTSLAIEGTASGEIATFNDGSNLPMRSLVCNIDAVQDLHGYDAPWVGGVGKNKLQNTETTTENNGITFTVNSDGSVKANGTATADAVLSIIVDTSKVYGDLYFVGCNGGSNNTYNVLMWDTTANARAKKWDGTTASANSIDGTLQQVKIVQGNNVKFQLRVMNGQTVNNVIFQPMICLSTETDPTFAPYSNICPISGHTGVDAWVRGKNRLPMTVDGIKTANTDTTWTGNACVINGITYTILTDSNNNVIGIKANGTASANAMLDLNPTGSLTIPANTTFSLSGCPEGGGGSTYRLYPKGGASATFDNGSGKLITLDSEITNPFRINIYSGAQVDNIIFYPMIVFTNAIDKDFVPYNPNSQTISVSWQTEAGEVFGGYVDLVSGELTVTHKYKLFDGTEAWTITSSSSGSNYITIDDMKVGTRMDGICNFFDTFITGTTAENAGKCQFGNDNQRLYILNAKGVYDADTQSKMRALTTGMQIVYPLATPITYQLTPTQIKSLVNDVTNAWASTGNVNVKYNKDATIAYENTGGGNSEIIPIAAGTDTATRTFTFTRTPKKVSVSYKLTSGADAGWAWDGSFIWGDDRIFGFSLDSRVAASGGIGIVEQIDYGADGKSFTITGHNVFGALNASVGEGRICVEY